MPLVRLVYCSKAKKSMSGTEIKDLVSRAQQNNQRAHISGFLFYGAGNFLQVLEGSASAVNRLYQRIAADDRHDELHLILYGEIHRRAFEGWSLGHQSLDPMLGTRVGRQVSLRYTQGFVDPYAMSAEAALGFLRDAAALAEPVEASPV